ncbi:MAG: response regulator transcription factor [Defluviitaleaceae bacterium]|nr:response regulator transcription factor [Defluviitaleaceae bacterium]MCL2275577.1 response regulator transcription factor [Defluviitaleaceae bacterium]
MIYLVEDDDNVRELLSYALRSAGFEIEAFESAMPFWARMETEAPVLFILDIMLPGEDGLAILAKLKKSHKTAHLPVIMLTALGMEHERVKGLDSGADDYIAKPFSVLELLARVRALLRRVSSQQHGEEAKAAANEHITLGELALNMSKRAVYVQEKEVMITFKEFELLYFLLQNAGKVLSRDRLLNHIWGYEYEGSSNRTVDMHIKTLRQKLGRCGEMIKTIRGVGYKIAWEE